MRVAMLTDDAQMIDRRILQEAATLVRGGHEVHLHAGFECREPTEYVYRGAQVHRYNYDWDDERLKKLRGYLPQHQRVQALLNRTFMFLAKRFFRISPFHRFILEKAYRFPADVVHVHDLPMLLPGTFLAQAWQVPLVYDAHELYYSQKVLPPAIRRKYFKLEKRLIRRADLVITVNEFLAKVMGERYGVAPPRVLYNAADLPPGAAEGSSRLRERVGGSGPILLLQGWIDGRNTDAIVRAMPYVAEPAVLAIIGYGPNELLLRQIARDLGIERRVHFLGAVPSDEILHYTRGAALGIIPYLPVDDNGLYCSPNKFFEFVLTGVPILAHPLPFFQEMHRRHGVAEFADFTSPKSVGETITRLMRENKLPQMSERCHEAAKVLNWSVEGEKLLAMYAGLQQHHRAAA